MEQTCARAVELGLRSVAFTDHADFTAWTLLGDEAGRVLSPPALPLEGYFECLLRCRERFPELQILSGVELSEPHWHSQAAASLVGQGGFDLVICGQHSLHHGPDAFIQVSDGYRSSEASAVVRSYLAEVGRMMDAWNDFEVLAHIDYPVRVLASSMPQIPARRLRRGVPRCFARACAQRQSPRSKHAGTARTPKSSGGGARKGDER